MLTLLGASTLSPTEEVGWGALIFVLFAAATWYSWFGGETHHERRTEFWWSGMSRGDASMLAFFWPLIAPLVSLAGFLLMLQGLGLAESDDKKPKVRKVRKIRHHQKAKRRPRGCGHLDAKISPVPDDWNLYECRSRREAKGSWKKCLRWKRYATRGLRMCPGVQRCCPSQDFNKH